MASNPLTNGQPSGAGENSSSPPQGWAAQQANILNAEMAREAAVGRAANATQAAAKRRPSTGGQRAPGIQATYDAMGQPSLPNPKKGRKG